MLVHAYYPIGETRVQREAEALVEAGFEVDVICLRQEGEPVMSTIGGVNIHRLPVKRRKGSGPGLQLLEYMAFFLLAFWKLTGLHISRRYHAVQVHNLPDFLVFAAVVPRLSGAAIILDLHDLMPEFFASRFHRSMSSLPVRLMILQERLACRFAHHVITVTETWRQELIGRGLPPGKSSVVMNLPDDRVFAPATTGPRREGGGRFTLLYHGTLTRRYGIDLALRGFAAARRDLPGLHFLVHGTGEYLEDIRALAGELELGESVTFSSRYLPVEELPALIASADLGLVPYRRDVFTDGILPTKLMEYAVLGVPALVSRTPVILEYFDDSMVAFFTPEDVEDLARTIRLLYHDRGRLEDLSRNIRGFALRYNWARHKAEYVKTIRCLMN